MRDLIKGFWKVAENAMWDHSVTECLGLPSHKTASQARSHVRGREKIFVRKMWKNAGFKIP